MKMTEQKLGPDKPSSAAMPREQDTKKERNQGKDTDFGAAQSPF